MEKMKSLTLQGIAFEVVDEYARNQIENGIGGASSWNDLKDKPFYEETEIVNEPLNITWDGNTEGLLCVEDEDNYITWCKVSDIILTDEQIKLITETSSNGNSDNMSDIWEELGATNDIVWSYWAIYVRKAGTELFDSGLIFPETGIYFYKDNYEYTTSITTTEPIEYVKSTIYKIDEKFLPEHTWDNLKNKPFGEPMLELGTIVGEFTGECVEANNYDGSKIIYTVDNVPAFPGECQEANANITVIYDGVEYKTTYWIENFGGMVYGIGNKGLYFSHAQDTGEPFAWYYFGGSYKVSSKEPGEHTLVVRVGDTITFTKLDKKFLPDDIGGGAKIVEKTFTVPAQSKMTRTAQSNGMEVCFNYLDLHEEDYSYQYRLIEGETYTFKAPDGNDYSVVASRLRGDGAVGFGIFTDTLTCIFEDIGDLVMPIVSVGDGLTVQVDGGWYNAFEYGISGKFEVTRCVFPRTIDVSVGLNSLENWNYINGVHVQQETLLGFQCLCDEYHALKYTIRHFGSGTFKAELAYPLCVFKTFGDNNEVTEVKMDYVVWYDYAKKYIYKTANFLTGEIWESDFGNA